MQPLKTGGLWTRVWWKNALLGIFDICHNCKHIAFHHKIVLLNVYFTTLYVWTATTTIFHNNDDILHNNNVFHNKMYYFTAMYFITAIYFIRVGFITEYYFTKSVYFTFLHNNAFHHNNVFHCNNVFRTKNVFHNSKALNGSLLKLDTKITSI